MGPQFNCSDIITLDIEFAPGEAASYEIEKTEGEYKYVRKQYGKPRVMRTFVTYDTSNDETRPRNRSNALEVLVVLFKFNQTGHPLLSFLPELVGLLVEMFPSEMNLSDVQTQYLISLENAELEKEFWSSVAPAVSWVSKRRCIGSSV